MERISIKLSVKVEQRPGENPSNCFADVDSIGCRNCSQHVLTLREHNGAKSAEAHSAEGRGMRQAGWTDVWDGSAVAEVFALLSGILVVTCLWCFTATLLASLFSVLNAPIHTIHRHNLDTISPGFLYKISNLIHSHGFILSYTRQVKSTPSYKFKTNPLLHLETYPCCPQKTL